MMNTVLATLSLMIVLLPCSTRPNETILQTLLRRTTTREVAQGKSRLGPSSWTTTRAIRVSCAGSAQVNVSLEDTEITIKQSQFHY